jgi:hypothetical protein
MTEIKIEKGVPIPERNQTTKYPWADMLVGDSFFIEGDRSKLRSSLSRIMANQRLRRGHRYSMRSSSDGIRVWRVE